MCASRAHLHARAHNRGHERGIEAQRRAMRKAAGATQRNRAERKPGSEGVLTDEGHIQRTTLQIVE